METITVNVQIQMDVKGSEDVLKQVQDTLELMNDIISMSDLESQPQIFISDISHSDIFFNDSEEE